MLPEPAIGLGGVNGAIGGQRRFAHPIHRIASEGGEGLLITHRLSKALDSLGRLRAGEEDATGNRARWHIIGGNRRWAAADRAKGGVVESTDALAGGAARCVQSVEGGLIEACSSICR